MTAPRVERNDEDLVAAARAGSREAFSQLVKLHQHEVYTLALRLTGNPDVAADVSQEAFIRAWRAMPQFRGDAKFSTWMYRIVVNTAWSHRKRAARHRSESLDVVRDEPAETGVSPERAGESLDLRPKLLAAMQRLSPQVRAVVVLKDVYDWEHHDIAQHLGISVTAAKVRLHRGRKQLRDMLMFELEDR